MTLVHIFYRTAAHAALPGSVTHSQDSAIYAVPCTRFHQCDCDWQDTANMPSLPYEWHRMANFAPRHGWLYHCWNSSAFKAIFYNSSSHYTAATCHFKTYANIAPFCFSTVIPPRTFYKFPSSAGTRVKPFGTFGNMFHTEMITGAEGQDWLTSQISTEDVTAAYWPCICPAWVNTRRGLSVKEVCSDATWPESTKMSYL